MRSTNSTTPTRWTTVASVTLAALLLVPLAARAAPDDGVAAAACTDVLLQATPDHVLGDGTAVAITAQALDRDVEGWVHLSWAAGEGTTLTGVTIRTATGVRTLTDDLASGTADDVLEITFCGTATSSPAAPSAPEADDAGDADEDQASGDQAGEDSAGDGGGTVAAPEPTPAASATSTTSETTSTTRPVSVTPADTDPREDADEETAGPDATAVGEAADLGDGTVASDASGGDDVSGVEDGGDGDVEVLGVQLTRDVDDAADRGGARSWLPVLLAAALAGLAVAFRHRFRTTPERGRR